MKKIIADTTEGVGLLPDRPEEEMPIPKPRRTRKARKLAWNERQYGAGLVAGIFIGLCIGVPLDAALAVLAKLFVGWLMAW